MDDDKLFKLYMYFLTLQPYAGPQYFEKAAMQAKGALEEFKKIKGNQPFYSDVAASTVDDTIKLIARSWTPG